MNIMPDEALDAALSIGEYSSRSDAACKEALACKEVLVRILQGRKRLPPALRDNRLSGNCP